jgi:methyl-accepting chemotaxis protein
MVRLERVSDMRGDTAGAVEAAGGTSDIADNISGVAQAAQATTSTLHEAGSSVAELSRVAGELRDVVARFRV